jgi:hypothetical protein
MENPEKSANVVKDPVCGMTVNPSTAKHSLEHAGKTGEIPESACSHGDHDSDRPTEAEGCAG